MTTDRGRWLPPVKCDARNFSNPCEFDRGSRAQRDADWQVVEELLALTTEAIKHLFDTDLIGVDQFRMPTLGYTCRVCGGMEYAWEKVCHAEDCPIGRFLALKARMEASHVEPALGTAAGGSPEHP